MLRTWLFNFHYHLTTLDTKDVNGDFKLDTKVLSTLVPWGFAIKYRSRGA